MNGPPPSGPARRRLARRLAVGLGITAIGLLGYQSVGVWAGVAPERGLVIGGGLLALAFAAGLTRRLVLVAVGYMMAVPVGLLFAIRLVRPTGEIPVRLGLWLCIAIVVLGLLAGLVAIGRYLVGGLFGRESPAPSLEKTEDGETAFTGNGSLAPWPTDERDSDPANAEHGE